MLQGCKKLLWLDILGDLALASYGARFHGTGLPGFGVLLVKIGGQTLQSQQKRVCGTLDT